MKYPAPIKSFLSQALTLSDDWRLYLLRHWPRLVGTLNTRMRLEKITDDALIIGVYDSHWMQELYLLSPVLIDTLNKELANRPIKRLRFKLVTQHKKVSLKKTTERPLIKKEIRRSPLTQREAAALKKIPDVELQEILALLLLNCQTPPD